LTGMSVDQSLQAFGESSLTKACILKLNDFEGPFDLLFHLFEKNRISIYDISLSDITDQYMEFLYAMNEMDLEIASEFLLVAATLLHIKSKALLPGRKQGDEEEETGDPEEELRRKLIEYKKFKDVSVILKEKAEYWGKAFYRLPDMELIMTARDSAGNSSDRKTEGEEFTERLFARPEHDDLRLALAMCYRTLMTALEERTADNNGTMKNIVSHDRISLRDKMKQITRILSGKVSMMFSELFGSRKAQKGEVVAGFLAMLELARLKKIFIEQKKHFTEIFIYRYRS